MRSTVGMTLAAGIAFLILKSVRLRDPRMERRLWLLVLCQGVILVPVTVLVPILSAPRSAEFQTEKEQGSESVSIKAVDAENFIPLNSSDEIDHTDEDLRSDEVIADHQPERVERDASEARSSVSRGVWIPEVSWPSLLVVGWCGGIVCLASVGIWRYRFWMRSLDFKLEPENAWLEEWEELLRSTGVQRKIPLEVVEEVGPALVWGKGGYRVVVPASRWRDLDEEIRKAVLAHELTHYLRGHLWSGFLGRCLVLVHWFNPAAWWVLRQLDQQAEFECDDAAADKDSTQLAEGLMRLGRGRGSREPALVHCVAGGRIHERVRRLLEERKPSAVWKGYASVGAGVLAILVAEFPLKAIPATESNSTEVAVGAPQNPIQTGERNGETEVAVRKVVEEEVQPGPKLLYQLGSDLYRSFLGFQHLELTSDGKFTVGGTGGRSSFTPRLNVFDTFTGEKLRTLLHPESEGQELLAVAISPDDRLVLAGESEGWLTIWDLKTGEALHRFQACETSITKILFHPSGRQFVCLGWNRTLYLRDLSAPEKVARSFKALESEETGLIDFAPAICGGFSEDGESLYVVSRGTTSEGSDLAFRKWNVRDGKLVQSGRLPKTPIDHTRIDFDPKTAEVVTITRKSFPVPRVDGPQNRRAASESLGSLDELVAIPLDRNREEKSFFRREADRYSAIIPTHQGLKLVTREDGGIGWNISGVRDETAEFSFRDDQKRFDLFSSHGVRISRDGKTAVSRTGHSQHLFLAVDLERGKLLTPNDCLFRDAYQRKSAWSNSSRFLATNFWQGFLSLMDVETGRVKWKVENPGSNNQSISFTSNDEFVVVYKHVMDEERYDRRVRLYRTENGELIHELQVSDDRPVTYPRQARQVAVSDDGKFVAVSCGRIVDETNTKPQIKVFNLETGEDVSEKSKEVIPDEKHVYGQLPRERWQHWIYDDFTFVPGTHKLMLADSEWGMRNGNRSGEPTVIIFNADEPTDVKEILLDLLNPEQKKMLMGAEINSKGLRFSQSGNRLASFVYSSGFPNAINAFCSWEFKDGEYVGFERGPDLDRMFVIDRVLNDEFFVTQSRFRNQDRTIEVIQYRSLTDGSILLEFELKRDEFDPLAREFGLQPGIYSHMKEISPDGEKMLIPTANGIMQVWDLTTAWSK